MLLEKIAVAVPTPLWTDLARKASKEAAAIVQTSEVAALKAKMVKLLGEAGEINEASVTDLAVAFEKRSAPLNGDILDETESTMETLINFYICAGLEGLGHTFAASILRTALLLQEALDSRGSTSNLKLLKLMQTGLQLRQDTAQAPSIRHISLNFSLQKIVPIPDTSVHPQIQACQDQRPICPSLSVSPLQSHLQRYLSGNVWTELHIAQKFSQQWQNKATQQSSG